MIIHKTLGFFQLPMLPERTTQKEISLETVILYSLIKPPVDF